MSLFSSLLSPNQTETTDSSPLDRWASMNSRALTISRPWLDSFFFLPPNELLPAAAVGAGVTMETVVIVAIGVLATIFLASFIALVVVCRHRYCHPHDLLHHFDSKSVNQCKSLYICRPEFSCCLRVSQCFSEFKLLKCIVVISKISVLLVLFHLSPVLQVSYFIEHFTALGGERLFLNQGYCWSWLVCLTH